MPRPLHIVAADALARASMRFPPLERALAVGTRNPSLRRRLHLGAVAHGYLRISNRPEIRVANLGSYRMYVNVSEPLGVQSYFFGDNCTPWLTRSLVRPGDVCIDAGANAGHYTFALATAVGAAGRVIAVEANPEFASLIDRSAKLNGFDRFVAVERRALWSSSGETMRFFLSTNPSNSGTSSLVNHGVYVSPEVSIEVATVTLDDLTRERQIDRVRLLKIDVERAEDHVLRGARALLSAKRVDYAIVEMYSASPSQTLLEEHGYAGYQLDWERRRLTPVSAVPANQFGDFLFVAPAVAEAFSRDFREALTGSPVP